MLPIRVLSPVIGHCRTDREAWHDLGVVQSDAPLSVVFRDFIYQAVIYLNYTYFGVN